MNEQLRILIAFLYFIPFIALGSITFFGDTDRKRFWKVIAIFVVLGIVWGSYETYLYFTTPSLEQIMWI